MPMRLKQSLSKYGVWVNLLLIQMVLGILMMILVKQHLLTIDVLTFFRYEIEGVLSWFIVALFLTNGKVIPYLDKGLQHRGLGLSGVVMGLLIGLIERIGVQFLIHLQMRIGVGMNLGSHQVTQVASVWDGLFVSGIMAPLYEEFLFRVLLFAVIAYGIDFFSHSTQGSNIYDVKNRACWIVIIISSCLFSFVHGPDLTSFHLYALGGVVNAWLFLKYGYLSAVVGHFSFNWLSVILFQLF